MKRHKFKIGQRVTMLPSRFSVNREGAFQIVRLLPVEQGINHYRIKSVSDGHERVVTESELR